MSRIDPNRLIKINIAEAIIDPFYETQFSCLDRYTFDGFIPDRCYWSQGWHFLNLRFDVVESDKLLGSLGRACRIDASDFDRFRMRVSLSVNVRISVVLTVDGVRQKVIDAIGPGEFKELFGVFSGDTIESIRVEFRAVQPGMAVGMVEWTMLESVERLDLLEQSQPTYDPAWPGYLVESVDPAAIQPTAGIFFGVDDLEEIRRKTESPLYATVMANLRSEAKRFLSLSPENHIAEVARYLYPFTRDRIYYIDGLPEFYVGATACALVGLLDQDTDALRMAARIALSQAFCASWDAWVDTVPETIWEDRGFPNFIIGVGCALALDWAGCIFTDLGREVIVKSLADKALPRIQQSLMKHGYMWYSNQGVWDLYGHVVCTIAISSRWRHGDMILDRVMEILNGIINEYIEEDGGSFEGVSYQQHTMAFAMLAAAAYARFRGKPSATVASPKLESATKYLLAVASEGSHPGSALPIADGGPVGKPMAAHCAALLHRLYGDTDLEPLIAYLIPLSSPDISMRIDNAATLIFGPESPRRSNISTPCFRILEDSCILTSSRPTLAGNIRVVLTGCQEKDAGHSHHDRGSIIIEAFGESLLNEVGMIDYKIPEHVLLKDPRYHCIACPGPLDSLPQQLLPTPGKILPSGTGDEIRLEATVDLTLAWGSPVISASRSIASSTPEELAIVDLFGLKQPGVVTVIFNTTGSIEPVSGGWRVKVGDACADILPEWSPVHYRIADNLYNAMKERCRVLMLESNVSSYHELVTRIRLRRIT